MSFCEGGNIRLLSPQDVGDQRGKSEPLSRSALGALFSPSPRPPVFGSIDAPSGDAAGSDAAPGDQSSYPGGKSGAGVFQRLINLIPQHRVLITAFAGQCGVARNIKPAEHTIVIDADADVCQWWDNWRRSPAGRDLEIHHCDGIEWLRHRFGLTEYCAAGSGAARASDADRDAEVCGDRGSRTIRRPVMATAAYNSDATAAVAQFSDGRPPQNDAAEAFVFCDPPYVLSERSHGKQYACELTDADHCTLVRILTAIPAARARIMLCGYASPIYSAVDREWRSIDHRVPTRGGLQDERIWMNYPRPERLHDHRYVGKCRRSRERIRRRQRNWLSQLEAMGDRERAAMLEVLASTDASEMSPQDAFLAKKEDQTQVAADDGSDSNAGGPA